VQPWCRWTVATCRPTPTAARITGRGWCSLAVLPLLCVMSAAMFCYGSGFYERDRAMAPVAAGPPGPAWPQAGHR
jgi:hypothetical protein